MDIPINVLLIEDNPGDARRIRELLAEANEISCCLLCADRLSSGIRQISDGGVDVVLLDLSLPDSRGIETFSKFHAQAKGLPIILLTGLEDGNLAMRAVREGAQNYLVKGDTTPRSLARAIRLAIERQTILTASADTV